MGLKKASAEEMRKSVYANYASFIRRVVVLTNYGATLFVLIFFFLVLAILSMMSIIFKKPSKQLPQCAQVMASIKKISRRLIR